MEHEKKVMMKLERATATKADIGLDTNDFRDMKYGTEGERQMTEDTQGRTGERARCHHKGRPMIGVKIIGRRKTWQTHGDQHTMRDKSKHARDIRTARLHHCGQHG